MVQKCVFLACTCKSTAQTARHPIRGECTSLTWTAYTSSNRDTSELLSTMKSCWATWNMLRDRGKKDIITAQVRSRQKNKNDQSLTFNSKTEQHNSNSRIVLGNSVTLYIALYAITLCCWNLWTKNIPP